MKPRVKPTAAAGVLVWLLLAALVAIGSADGALGAAVPKGLVIQNFRSALEFHPPPHQQQMKSFLEGARAEPLPGGSYRLTGVRLRTFREQGEPEMTVEAPESIFDREQRTVSSAGALRVATADGKFLIEGEGYRWGQTNSSLTISNRVRTVVHPELFNAKAAGDAQSASETGPIEITSSRFDYAEALAAGRYSGGVRVVGTNLLMTSDTLTITAPMEERELKAIKAEGQVRLQYAGIEAEGELADYWAESGILRVTGNPRWKGEDQEGAADSIVIDRPNRVFDADGRAYLRLAGDQALPGGFLPSPASKASPGVAAERGFVEVRSESYQLRTNSAWFKGGVQVRQEGSARAPVLMSSQTLRLQFTGTNEIQSLAAEGQVQVDQQDSRIRAERMDYEAAAAKVTFLGRPEWQSGPRRGRGERIEIDTERKEMWVRKQAWMQLPAGDLGDTTGVGLPGGAPGARLETTPVPAEVTCEEYRVGEREVEFTGQVRVTHPQVRWESDRIRLELGEPPVEQRLVAEPRVIFEVTDAKGQNMSGRADRAVYTRSVTAGATNSVVELLGAPATLQMTNGMTIRNRKLVWDLGKGTFSVSPGAYEILGPTNAVDTNIFQMPGREILEGRKPRSKR